MISYDEWMRKCRESLGIFSTSDNIEIEKGIPECDCDLLGGKCEICKEK